MLSAWCLGVLNSHHRFLLSYARAGDVERGDDRDARRRSARGTPLPRLAVMLAWGSVVGSALQFVVQLPVVLRVAPDLRFALDTASDARARRSSRNFVPVFISRGVVQVSAYVDTLLASLLPTGAVTGLPNAQLLYTLPVSLFGMSVSAAELPAMSGVAASDAGGTRRAAARGSTPACARSRSSSCRRRWRFSRSATSIAAALLQTGRFTHDDAVYVWGILAGSAVGLLASTLGRLYSSTYYALRDTRTPLRFAIVRVALTTVLGYLFAIPLPRLLGHSAAVGRRRTDGVGRHRRLGRDAAAAATLNARIGRTGLPAAYVAQLWAAAAAAAAVAWGVKLALPVFHPIVAAIVVLGPYGLIYFAVTFALGIPEASSTIGRLASRFRAR